jgi:hypothetical protein
MFYSALIFDDDVLQAYRGSARTAPGRFGAYVDHTVKPYVEGLVENSALTRAPLPVSSPFEFATPQSQAAFFASGGFGQGIPTRRRDPGVEDAWHVGVDRRRNVGFMSIYNDDPAAIFVFGEWQTPGHRRSGWGEGHADALLDISEKANDKMINGWHQIVGM